MTDEKLILWLDGESERALAIVEHNSGVAGDRSLKAFWEYKGYRAAINAVLWRMQAELMFEEALKNEPE